MSVLDKVARAVKTKTPIIRPEPGQLFRCVGEVAIEAFLKAAAEQGWHMRPDEATGEMMNYLGPDFDMEAEDVQYRGMMGVAPEFKWKDDS